jgi:hypothetical protein
MACPPVPADFADVMNSVKTGGILGEFLVGNIGTAPKMGSKSL